MIKSQNLRGEIVIIIEKNEQKKDAKTELASLDIEEQYKYYEKLGYEKKDIIKKIAKLRNVDKNEIYMKFIKK